MFALIISGQIDSLTDTVPPAPDPLPDGYVAPDYRPVVDGAIPPVTTGSVIPRAMDQWTIQPTQVLRTWQEVFLTAAEIARRAAVAKREQVHKLLIEAIATETEPDFSGIGVSNFPLSLRSQVIAALALKANDSRVDSVVASAQANFAPIGHTHASLAATGAITSSGGGIGYAAGAGGVITQLTSKATAVTLSKLCGDITMHAASMAAGAVINFTLTNTTIAASDCIHVQHQAGGTFGPYLISGRCAAGSATIAVRNTSSGALAEAIVIRFAVIKSAQS